MSVTLALFKAFVHASGSLSYTVGMTMYVIQSQFLLAFMCMYVALDSGMIIYLCTVCTLFNFDLNLYTYKLVECECEMHIYARSLYSYYEHVYHTNAHYTSYIRRCVNKQ